MLGDEVLFQSASELGPQIHARKISPVELTESYLARIQKYNGSLNAFETITADLARTQARTA